MDYYITGDFRKCPLGPFTHENKKLVWPGITDDFDPYGYKYEIVDDPRFVNGSACRMKYPVGHYGMQDQSYQIRLRSPTTIANLEFYWLFEQDFSFYTPNTHQAGGGKIGPCINWGEIGGVEAKRGTRAMWWYNANGSNHEHPVFSPSCQDQRSGHQLIQPPRYTKPIVTEQMYKFRIRLEGGPYGMAEYFQDDVLIGRTECAMLVSSSDDVIFDFAFFAGGATPDFAPTHDSYARHGGVRMWSGKDDPILPT